MVVLLIQEWMHLFKLFFLKKGAFGSIGKCNYLYPLQMCIRNARYLQSFKFLMRTPNRSSQFSTLE